MAKSSASCGLLIGVDLVRSPDALREAYDDPQGVTAEFNLNLLDRLNRDADADFQREGWSHRATWNPERSQMESDLVSRRNQRVSISTRTFVFARGDAIRTEISKKYTPRHAPAIDRVLRLQTAVVRCRTALHGCLHGGRHDYD